MTKPNKESPTRRKAKQILGELNCFIYRSDAHYDKENYENDLDIIEELIKKQKGGEK